MTSRERVWAALRFATPDRPPRQVWIGPWAEIHHPDHVRRLRQRWPDDVACPPDVYRPSTRRQGDPFAVGTSVDEWGCTFVNLQAGVHGEVQEPLVPDLARWQDNVRPPYETLPADVASARQRVGAFCASSSKFVLTGCFQRPWERYQFLRGTASALSDLLEAPEESAALLTAINDFYLAEIDFWCSTDVDGIFFMDDWGSQSSLLINPRLWRMVFKPIYAEYIRRIHAAGKAAFMHSDGNILAILPDLVEIGLDALNSQLFCMDMAKVAEIAKGRLAFWGEIDRQQVLPGPPEGGTMAVNQVVKNFYDPRGGCFTQFEYGAGARPETVDAVLEAWDRISTPTDSRTPA